MQPTAMRQRTVIPILLGLADLEVKLIATAARAVERARKKKLT
jgi:hypothetical protein